MLALHNRCSGRRIAGAISAVTARQASPCAPIRGACNATAQQFPAGRCVDAVRINPDVAHKTSNQRGRRRFCNKRRNGYIALLRSAARRETLARLRRRGCSQSIEKTGCHPGGYAVAGGIHADSVAAGAADVDYCVVIDAKTGYACVWCRSKMMSAYGAAAIVGTAMACCAARAREIPNTPEFALDSAALRIKGGQTLSRKAFAGVWRQAAEYKSRSSTLVRTFLHGAGLRAAAAQCAPASSLQGARYSLHRRESSCGPSMPVRCAVRQRLGGVADVGAGPGQRVACLWHVFGAIDAQRQTRSKRQYAICRFMKLLQLANSANSRMMPLACLHRPCLRKLCLYVSPITVDEGRHNLFDGLHIAFASYCRDWIWR